MSFQCLLCMILRTMIICFQVPLRDTGKKEDSHGNFFRNLHLGRNGMFKTLEYSMTN